MSMVEQSPTISDSQLHNLDAMLIGHWMMVSLQLGCLDPASSNELGSMYLDLIRQPESVALPAILAGSAAHMLSLNLIPEQVFVQAKQRSLKTMIKTLKDFNSTSINDLDTGTSTQEPHQPPTALNDASVLASLLLLGPGIIYGGSDHNIAHVRWLLQGARSLIVERYKYFQCHCGSTHPARSMPQFKLDSPLFVSTVRSLAYTDILACVPCAKKPLFHKAYWLDEATRSMYTGAQALRPDMDLGYCASILSLLGDCATAVDELYSQSINKTTFLARQAMLVKQLELAIQDLPPFVDSESIGDVQGPVNKHMIVAHNHSIRAASSHALATQIFLLRSTNLWPESPGITILRNRLYYLISSVPIDHPAATIMLWPIWVLGCECYSDDDQPSRQYVTTILKSTYESSRMNNVEMCLTRLKQDIWTQRFEFLDEVLKQSQSLQQSAWVRRCWDQKIELLLA